MSKIIKLMAVAALAATPVLAQQGSMQGMDHSKMGGMQGMDHSKMDMSGPLARPEMDMMNKMMAARGANVSETWTRKMIEHHRGAIGMSRAVLANRPDARTRQKAQETIAAQTKEIAELQASLRSMGKRAQ